MPVLDTLVEVKGAASLVGFTPFKAESSSTCFTSSVFCSSPFALSRSCGLVEDSGAALLCAGATGGVAASCSISSGAAATFGLALPGRRATPFSGGYRRRCPVGLVAPDCSDGEGAAVPLAESDASALSEDGPCCRCCCGGSISWGARLSFTAGCSTGCAVPALGAKLGVGAEGAVDLCSSAMCSIKCAAASCAKVSRLSVFFGTGLVADRSNGGVPRYQSTSTSSSSSKIATSTCSSSSDEAESDCIGAARIGRDGGLSRHEKTPKERSAMGASANVAVDAADMFDGRRRKPGRVLFNDGRSAVAAACRAAALAAANDALPGTAAGGFGDTPLLDVADGVGDTASGGNSEGEMRGASGTGGRELLIPSGPLLCGLLLMLLLLC